MGLFNRSNKSTKYLGGSGDALTVWISIAASTVLIFYGYDQVSVERDDQSGPKANHMRRVFLEMCWSAKTSSRRWAIHLPKIKAP